MGFPKHLRIASVPHFRLKSFNKTSDDRVIIDFYEQAFTQILSQKLGFSFVTVTPTDGQFGSLLPDGSWSGMVGMLERNEADLAVRTLSITEDRLKVIDFTYPYHIDRLLFATRNLERSIDKLSFLKPFSVHVWICIFACVLILPVLSEVLLKKILPVIQPRKYQRSIFQTLLPSDGSIKFFLDVPWVVVQTLLRWCYTALLLSFLSFPTLTGVRSIPELADAVIQDLYTCTAFPGAFYSDIMLKSVDTNLKVIGECLKKNKGHPNFVAALSSTESPKKPSYIAEESRFFGVGSNYFVSKDGFAPDYIAIGLRKNFCCKAELDSLIHKIWSTGIYNDLIYDFWQRDFNEVFHKSPESDQNIDERRLSFVDLQGIFILLIVGHSFAVLLVFIEIILGKYKRHGKSK